ncbi:rubrerythrin [bacterium]|nr:rubrerythrin [bacterium]
MLSKLPINLDKVSQEDIDREIARIGMIAELDAVNLYEQLAQMAQDETLKKVLLDIAKEEKTHLGEFQAILLKKDPEQAEELKKGKEEVAQLSQ